jgi:hypothetical protein
MASSSSSLAPAVTSLKYRVTLKDWLHVPYLKGVKAVEDRTILYFYVPMRVMRDGATSLDPNLFVPAKDTRHLREMAAFFMHVCYLLGELDTKPDDRAVMSERMLLDCKSLPTALQKTDAPSEALFQHACEHRDCIAGMLYTITYNDHTKIRKKKTNEAFQRERDAKMREYAAKKKAYEDRKSDERPDKEEVKVPRFEEQGPLFLVMQHIYGLFRDSKRQNMDKLDQEFLKRVPSHGFLRNLIRHYTGIQGYMQLPCPTPEHLFNQDSRFYLPTIFSFENTGIQDENRLHPACVSDLLELKDVKLALPLCRCIATAENAADSFASYLFPFVEDFDHEDAEEVTGSE